MDKRRLGRDGPEVSAIGLGAMSFAGIYGEASEAEAHAVLAAALELGIDHIDTSNVYGAGRSERLIGSFLAGQGGGGTTSSASPPRPASPATPPPAPAASTTRRAHLEAELDKSLARLGIEAVDLFYVHRRDPAVPIEEVAESLAALVRAGKARAVGFSEIAPVLAPPRRRGASGGGGPVRVLARHPRPGARPGAGHRRARGGARRLLAGRPRHADRRPARAGADRRLGLPARQPALRRAEPRARTCAVVAGFRALAAEMGVPAAALAVAWLLARGPRVLPIPGTRSVAHLRELAAGAALRLGPGDLARIEERLPVGWAHGDRYTTGNGSAPSATADRRAWLAPVRSVIWREGRPAMRMPDPDPAVLARKAEIVRGLRAILPAADAVIDDAAEVRAYECDALTAYRCPPLAVVLPASTEEVAAVLRLCHAERVPVVPRGSGTSLAGGALPTADCVILGVARLNRVLEVSIEDRFVRVQSGRTNLSRHQLLSSTRTSSTRPTRRASSPAPSPATSR